MPFKSRAQQRYLYAKEPAVAREFQRETPKNAKLPEHVNRGTAEHHRAEDKRKKK